MSAITQQIGQATGADRPADVGPAVPMDRSYFLGIWALMVTGIVFVFSASFPVAGRPDRLGLPGNPYKYLVQHSIYVGIALIAMLLTSRLRPSQMRVASPIVFALGVLGVCLALFSPWGISHGGAPRWLKLPFLPEFQPSELLKVGMIMMLALVLARKDEGKDEPSTAYSAVLLVTGVIAFLLLMQRDQGMATMFVLIAVAMLFFAGMSLWKLVPLVMGLAGAGLLLAYQEPYRWRRIIAFVNPEGAPRDEGYHILNMLIAQARGGVFGMGLGMSPDKWRSLPAAHTDSIFSVIGCELGLLGALVILVAVAALTVRALWIAHDASSPYGFYVAAGAAALLCLQSLAHIGVNTSCIPCTGLTLPFLSGGGTSLVSASVAAGMVLAVSRYPGRGGR